MKAEDKKNHILISFEALTIKEYKKIFEQFYSDLCNFAYSFVKRAEIAEDIVQDVFLMIWENRQKLQLHTSLRSYLFTSVRNKSLNYLKSKVADVNLCDEWANEIADETGEGNEMSIEAINLAIEKLPEKCKIIFNLSKFKGYSYIEIATELNLSIKTVETQMGIALKKIRHYVKDFHFFFLFFYKSAK